MRSGFHKLFIVTLILGCGILLVFCFNDSICTQWRLCRAERFLKENIAGYGWVDSRLTDVHGEPVPFTPYDYETLYVAKDTLDSLRRCVRSSRTVYADQSLLNDDSLHAIVREAYSRWQNGPYFGQIDFRDFCEYLLPYRAGKEKLDMAYWDTIRQRYAGIVDSLGNDPVAAAVRINQDLKSRVEFDLRSHALLSEPSPAELIAEGKGSCRAISALFVQVMRSVGIAAAIDECPVWAHRNSGHEWTVVMDTTGRWSPFEPAEFGPDEFRSVNENTRTPKIFRRTFSFDPSFYPPVASADMPSLFTTFNRKDVTREYVSVSDVTVVPDRNLDKSNGILYLAVFNAEAWHPVAWAEINNRGEAHFTEMGNNNILYLPVFYRDGRNYPAGPPFVLDSLGRKHVVEANGNRRNKLDMGFVNLYWTTVWDTFVPAPGRRLELYVWDDRWVFCDSTQSGPAPNYRTRFRNVPAEGIYWIRGPWDNTWQRPFMADTTSEGSIWY